MTHSESLSQDHYPTGGIYHLWREKINGKMVYFLRGHNNKKATARGGPRKVKSKASDMLKNGSAFAVFTWFDESDAINRPDRWIDNVYVSEESVSINHTGDLKPGRRLK